MMYKITGRYRSNGGFLLYSDWYIIWLLCKSIYAVLSYSWDIYMDWGLLRSKEQGKYGLRDKLYYPSWVYYWCIVSDGVLKCTWMIAAGLDSKQQPWLASLWYTTLLGLLELLRRWQWSLLRIENEQINNYEKYRNVVEIPEVNEWSEDKQEEENKYSDMVKKVLV